MNQDDLRYFPTDYRAAREHFRNLAISIAAENPKAERREFQVPSANEKDLTVDYLYIPATGTPRTLAIILSGVHGVEGYAGSAIQNMLLTEMRQQLTNEGLGCLFVHALNPFGFLRHRRVTENNVNLNRNFALDETIFKTPNPGYRGIAHRLNPESKAVAPELAFPVNVAKMTMVLARPGGPQNLTQSVAQGQFEYPDGIEYGGTKCEPQVADFINELRKRMPAYREALLFDLHTGLGDQDQLHLIPCDDERGRDRELFHVLFDPPAEKDIYHYTPSETEGFYRTVGDSNPCFAALLAPEQRGLAFTVEFGTLGANPYNRLDAMNRVIVENQAYHHGALGPLTQARIGETFFEMFCPTRPEWRKSVISRARRLFKNVLARAIQH